MFYVENCIFEHKSNKTFPATCPPFEDPPCSLIGPGLPSSAGGAPDVSWMARGKARIWGA